MNRVLSTEEFDKQEQNISKDYQDQIRKIIQELKTTSDVGKPLGFPFFREKKMDKYRVYFLIYKEHNTILLVTISDKKTQQETIDEIKRDLSIYKELIKKTLNI